jgi:hypothetical protein
MPPKKKPKKVTAAIAAMQKETERLLALSPQQRRRAAVLLQMRDAATAPTEDITNRLLAHEDRHTVTAEVANAQPQCAYEVQLVQRWNAHVAKEALNANEVQILCAQQGLALQGNKKENIAWLAAHEIPPPAATDTDAHMGDAETAAAPAGAAEATAAVPTKKNAEEAKSTATLVNKGSDDGKGDEDGDITEVAAADLARYQAERILTLGNERRLLQAQNLALQAEKRAMAAEAKLAQLQTQAATGESSSARTPQPNHNACVPLSPSELKERQDNPYLFYELNKQLLASAPKGNADSSTIEINGVEIVVKNAGTSTQRASDSYGVWASAARRYFTALKALNNPEASSHVQHYIDHVQDTVANNKSVPWSVLADTERAYRYTCSLNRSPPTPSGLDNKLSIALAASASALAGKTPAAATSTTTKKDKGKKAGVSTPREEQGCYKWNMGNCGDAAPDSTCKHGRKHRCNNKTADKKECGGLHVKTDQACPHK